MYRNIFSKIEFDRCRFDNYDDLWNIPSRPNHFHPRFKKEVISSEMIGKPDKDIPVLCILLKSGKLKEISNGENSMKV